MSLKRILNELHNIIPKKLLENNIYELFTFVEIGNDIICRDIGLINNLSGTIEIKFLLNNSYPFKSPNVYILMNNQYVLYSNWLVNAINYKNFNTLCVAEKNYNAWIFAIIRWPLFKKYLKFPRKGICYCCESIICSRKWSPSLTLADILFEYIIIKQFYIYSRNSNQRIINSIFYNDKWKISNDIIEHIITFL